MPGLKIRADYDALKQVAQSFSQQADNTSKLLQSLKGQMDTLQGGDWIGQGANAFYAEMNDSVLPTFQRLSQALQSGASITQQISQQMKTAEDEAARVLRGDGSAALMAKAAVPPAAAAYAGPVGAAGAPAGPAPAGAGAMPPLPPYRPDLRTSKLSDAKRQERAAEVQKLLDAGKKDEAIMRTIQLYHIDVSTATGVPQYNKYVSGTGDADAVTWPDGRVFIGDSALDDSPGWLASVIGHEIVHTQQMKEGRWTTEPQGYNMCEIEAYDSMIKNAAENDLNEADVIAIERARQVYYNQLNPANQRQIRQGLYTPFKPQIF